MLLVQFAITDKVLTRVDTLSLIIGNFIRKYFWNAFLLIHEIMNLYFGWN